MDFSQTAKKFLPKTSKMRRSEIAEHLSLFYPPIELPDDKSKWTAGDECLAEFNQKFPRNQLILPSLARYGYFKQNRAYFNGNNNPEKHLFEYAVATASKEDFSYLYRVLLYLKYNWYKTKKDISERLTQKPKITDETNMFLAYLRAIAVPFEQLIEKIHIANCGELSDYAEMLMENRNQQTARGILSFSRKDGSMQKDNEHAFVLFRTDNKELSTQNAIADLYHPNMRILDLWLGKCLPTKEMFQEYISFFPQVERINKKYVASDLKPNTALILNINNSREDYIVGRVKNRIWVPGEQRQCEFAPVQPYIYIPEKEKSLALLKQKQRDR